MTAYYQSKAAKRRIDIRKEAAVTDRLIRAFERKLEARLKQLFTSQFNTAARLYEAGDDASLLESFALDFNAIMMPHYGQVIETFGQKFMDDRAIKFSFDELMDSFIVEHGAKSVRNVSEYTKSQLRDQISKGLKEGESRKQIAKRIQGVGTMFSKHRSITIARTETHTASSYATHEMNKKFMPTNTLKQWVSTSDPRTRSHHVAMNGKRVPMDDKFIVMTNGLPVQMRYAGDPIGGPANVINCRCRVIYINPDDEIVATPDAQGQSQPVAPEVEKPAKPKPITVDEQTIQEQIDANLAELQAQLDAEAAEAAKKPKPSLGESIGKPAAKPAIKPDEVGAATYSTVPWILKDGIKPTESFGDVTSFDIPLAARYSREAGKSYGLTDQEVSAIYSYTGAEYTYQNPYFRAWFEGRNSVPPRSEWGKAAGSVGGRDVTDKVKADLLYLNNRIRDGLKKMPKYEGLATRGITIPAEKLDDYIKNYSVKEGAIYRTESITSTGRGNRGWPGNVQFRIQSKSGRYIDSMSAMKGEDEVLYVAGHEFRITKVTRNGNDLLIEMDDILDEIKHGGGPTHTKVVRESDLPEFKARKGSKRLFERMATELYSVDNILITV